MRNTINRHNAYKAPSALTAMTQLFSLQLPSDLVSIWIPITAIYKVLRVPLSLPQEFRLTTMPSFNFQTAWTLKIHMRQLETQIPMTAGTQPLTLNQGPLLCCSLLQKGPKWFFWELLHNAPCWMWWWQQGNLHIHQWQIFKYCIALWMRNPHEDSCLSIHDEWMTAAK